LKKNQGNSEAETKKNSRNMELDGNVGFKPKDEEDYEEEEEEEVQTPLVKPIAVKPAGSSSSQSDPMQAFMTPANQMNQMWNYFASPAILGANSTSFGPQSSGKFQGFSTGVPANSKALATPKINIDSTFNGVTPMLSNTLFLNSVKLTSNANPFFGQSPSYAIQPTPSLPLPKNDGRSNQLQSPFLSPPNQIISSKLAIPSLDGALGPSAAGSGLKLHDTFQRLNDTYQQLVEEQRKFKEDPVLKSESGDEMSEINAGFIVPLHRNDKRQQSFEFSESKQTSKKSKTPNYGPFGYSDQVNVPALEIATKGGMDNYFYPQAHEFKMNSFAYADTNDSSSVYDSHYHDTDSSSKNSSKKGKTGTSCHQCKSRQDKAFLSYCKNQKTNLPENSNRPCRKKYCDGCLTKFYNEKHPEERHSPSK
jgi:hypothetical protein